MAEVADRTLDGAAADRRPRILWLDAARGVGIAAMVVYHGAFDLLFFGHVDWPVTTHPVWRAFAAAIASTFLFLVGVSLVVAHHDGVRWRAYLRRLAVIAAAAGAVTLATTFAMPAPIYFGILHAIAAFSVLALPFLFAPVSVVVIASLAVFALPFVVRHEVFAAAWAYPLGLAPVPPYTFDYEPIFPWFAVTLAGVAMARWRLPRPVWRTAGPQWHALAWLGRHSLLIYLVHQPVIFAGLIAIRWTTAA